MNLFLSFLLLLLGGAAYYEYNWQQQSEAGFQSQINAWQQKVDTLEAINKKLTSDRLDIEKQIAEAHQRLESTPLTATPSTSLATPSTSNLPASPQTPLQWQAASHGTDLSQPVSLGTITTILGKTYQNCQILKIGVNDITVTYDGGITQIPFSSMSPDLQKRFGYDPQKAATMNAAEIRYEEQLHQTTAPAPGQ